MNKGEKVLSAIGLIIFIGVIAGLVVMEWSNCEGTLVRGLIWFECLK